MWLKLRHGAAVRGGSGYGRLPAAVRYSLYSGQNGADGDVKMSPTKVEQYLQATAIDQGLPGYDKCFGNGRIDALRAVKHDTSKAYDSSAPFCPEYKE